MPHAWAVKPIFIDLLPSSVSFWVLHHYRLFYQNALLAIQIFASAGVFIRARLLPSYLDSRLCNRIVDVSSESELNRIIHIHVSGNAVPTYCSMNEMTT